MSKFDRSAAATQGTEIPNLSTETFVQYAADNVDHNSCPLDGYNTFHGMGMIAAITPGTSNRQPIPCISVTADDIAEVGKINIQQFISQHEGMQEFQYQQLRDYNDVEDPTSNAEIIYQISRSLRSPSPSWTE